MGNAPASGQSLSPDARLVRTDVHGHGATSNPERMVRLLGPGAAARRASLIRLLSENTTEHQRMRRDGRRSARAPRRHAARSQGVQEPERVRARAASRGVSLGLLGGFEVLGFSCGGPRACPRRPARAARGSAPRDRARRLRAPSCARAGAPRPFGPGSPSALAFPLALAASSASRRRAAASVAAVRSLAGSEVAAAISVTLAAVSEPIASLCSMPSPACAVRSAFLRASTLTTASGVLLSVS